MENLSKATINDDYMEQTITVSFSGAIMVYEVDGEHKIKQFGWGDDLEPEEVIKLIADEYYIDCKITEDN